MNKRLIKVMAVSSALSVILLYFRIQWSGSLMFVFLTWNLFLAWIPFLLAFVLSEMNNNGTSRIKKVGVFAAWLLFFYTVFSGALRKWVLGPGQAGNILFLIQLW